jgi:hypothetical protein
MYTNNDIDNAINCAIKAGFVGNNLVLAVSISGAESGFNPNKIGDVSLRNESAALCGGLWEDSVGLWQIRSLQNPSQCGYPDNMRDATKLLDPQFNRMAAYAISQHGNDFSPWSTYTQGDYLRFTTEVENRIARLGL